MGRCPKLERLARGLSIGRLGMELEEVVELRDDSFGKHCRRRLRCPSQGGELELREINRGQSKKIGNHQFLG